MTRFTKDSFKITPVQIEGKTKADESIDGIPKLLEERISQLDTIPCNGWVPFQDATYRDALNNSLPIEVIPLSNGINIVAATSVLEVLNTNLKRSLKASRFSSLPENEKYKIIPFDYVFFNDSNKNLFCLISATSDQSVKICLNEFLLKSPFSDLGLTIMNNPNCFRIPVDIFNWLFYKYYENKMIDDNISIKGIHLADGRTHSPLSSQISLQYKGKAAPLYLHEMKFSLVDRRTFTRGGFDLEIDGNLFNFILDENGCVEFRPSECEYSPEESDLALNNFGKAIYIYNAIIPKIKEAYINDASWTQEKDKFLRKCAEDCKTELDNNSLKLT